MGFSPGNGFATRFLLLAFVTGSEGARLIGCYKEISVEARLMSDDHKDFRNTLTPEKCISYCKSKGYLYAGLQYSYECFCSRERPRFIQSADSSDCSSKCDGDRNKICGGNLRLSVYDILDKPVNYVQPNYVGCIADDSPGRRALAEKTGPETNLMTPELCVGFCFRNGYRYAGIQYKTQCFCGEKPNGPNVSEGDCDMPCAGDSRFLCGGGWRNSVYHTSIPDESDEGKVIGCFIDSLEFRLLSGFKIDIPETNSPRKCISICKSLGYAYAGVEYGLECHCGNRSPEREKEKGENECLATCPNGLRRCGGNWRLLIFSTSALHQHAIVPGILLARPETSGNQPIVLGTNQVIPVTSLKPVTTRTTHRTTIAPTQRTTSTIYNRTPTTSRTCIRSHSQVNGRNVCQGERLFYDSFIGSELNSNKWSHEVFMPTEPDYEFVVFENSPQNSYVSSDRLHIKAFPYEDEFVRRGKLELDRCTGRLYTEECIREAKTFSFLPPVQSARITTKNSFSFKFGKVTVRAKLPLGDWLVPEIWLEPKRKIYGPSYSSGRIRIAAARGNKDLISQSRERIGNSLLESGILMGKPEKIRGRTVKREISGGWYQQFHNYTLVWGPDIISFLVDGEDREDLLPSEGGKLYEILGFDYNDSDIWQEGSSLAPFDQDFYISIGLSVGGMKAFPDYCTSNGHSKPWNNEEVKAVVKFWEDRENWQSTWRDQLSELQIDEISIYAI